jgi:hypothetical protein
MNAITIKFTILQFKINEITYYDDNIVEINKLC